MIFLFVTVKIVHVIGIVLDTFFECGSSTHFQVVITGQISFKFICFYGFFIETLCNIIFITYMIILEDYFTLCQVNLERLFSGTQFSICQNSLTLPEENDHASTSSDENLPSAHSIDLTPTHDLNQCRLFSKSVRVPIKSAFTQTCLTDENMDQFLQNMQLIHASVLEVYNTYELLMSFLGFPLLYFTFYVASSVCFSTFSFMTIITSDKVDICTAVNLFVYCLTSLLNFLLLTTFPHSLDQKASSFICEHFSIL